MCQTNFTDILSFFLTYCRNLYFPIGKSFKKLSEGDHDVMIYTLMVKVYLISIGSDNKRYKIGFTKRKVEQRIREMRTGNSEEFTIENVFESKWASKIESSLHQQHQSKKISGEWFDLTETEAKNFATDCQRLHDLFELLSKENTYVIDRGWLK